MNPFLSRNGSNFGFGSAKPKESQAEKMPKKRQRHVECLELSQEYLYRRAFSETELLDVLPMDFKDGHSIHCITGGDVDSLSYLRAVMRRVSHLDHLLFSTWCMADEDVLQFRDWLKSGKIRRLDAYVGEIFPGSYAGVYELLVNVFDEFDCGRICVFRNHSKIYAGTGPEFSFGIETSANINTNPRTENGCITIGGGIYEFYKSFFDGIESFDKNGHEK